MVDYNLLFKQKMVKGSFSCLCVGLVILPHIILDRIPQFLNPVNNNTTQCKEFNIFIEADGQFINFAGNRIATGCPILLVTTERIQR